MNTPEQNDIISHNIPMRFSDDGYDFEAVMDDCKDGKLVYSFHKNIGAGYVFSGRVEVSYPLVRSALIHRQYNQEWTKGVLRIAQQQTAAHISAVNPRRGSVAAMGWAEAATTLLVPAEAGTTPDAATPKAEQLAARIVKTLDGEQERFYLAVPAVDELTNRQGAKWLQCRWGLDLTCERVTLLDLAPFLFGPESKAPVTLGDYSIYPQGGELFVRMTLYGRVLYRNGDGPEA